MAGGEELDGPGGEAGDRHDPGREIERAEGCAGSGGRREQIEDRGEDGEGAAGHDGDTENSAGTIAGIEERYARIGLAEEKPAVDRESGTEDRDGDGDVVNCIVREAGDRGAPGDGDTDCDCCNC